jgi:hypothetical protein
MNAFLIGIIFLIGLVVGVTRGPAWVFVLVYLPSILLFSQVQEMNNVPHLPISCVTAPLYAMLVTLPFGTGVFKLKWSSVDTIFALLLVSGTITAWSTALFETGVNTFRGDLLVWMLPYYTARVVFQDWQIRRLAVYVLVPVLAFITLVALYEARFYPYAYLHTLQNMGMGNRVSPMAYNRFGFFRVAATVEHPIYFGNMCVVLAGMLAVLTTTCGLKLKNPLVLGGIGAALLCVLLSFSFTPYLGIISSAAIVVILMFAPWTRKLLIPGTLAVVAGLFAFTYNVATTPLPPKPDSSLDIEGSLWTRKLIIHEAWQLAESAGPFGHGFQADYSTDEDFDLASVDNSYMQFTMTRGWVYTALWISIGIFFSFRMTRAFLAVQHKKQIFPLAVATAVALGLMLSMYTVWAGALYTTIWAILLGLGNTLAEQVIEAAKPVRAGFPVIQARGPGMQYRPVPV